jgi:DNA-binding MarR family transcriptional regulator
MRELRCMSGDRLRRSDIGFTNLHVLSILEGHGEMSMGHLAEILDVALSNASGVIDRLEDRGLVERVRVPGDRRVVVVRVTPAGRAELARADVLKDELLQSILARLDDRRLDRLAAALDDVASAALEVFATDPEFSRHEHVLDHGRQPAHHESASVSASHA